MNKEQTIFVTQDLILNFQDLLWKQSVFPQKSLKVRDADEK